MSHGSRRPRASGPTPAGPAGGPPAGLLVGALLALLLLQYGDVFHLPFLFDDYTILRKVHGRSLIDLWMPRELLYGWYRPWSRETHFWVLERVFGPRPGAFHAVNLGLWLACTMTFYALARRLAGSGAATIATCGLAVFGGWSGTLLWASGAQESWMVLFSLIALSAFLVRRTVWATAFLALALLSKETACVVPGIALVICLLERDSAWTVVRRLAPLAAVDGVWAFVHPTLRQHGSITGAAAGVLATNAIRTILSFANLERFPKPEHGWLDALGAAIPVLAVLSIVLVWTRRAAAAPAAGTHDASIRRTPASSPETSPVSPVPGGRVAILGLGWCALASIPAVITGGSWATYYCVLAACGTWLAAGVLLARRPLVSAALILAVATLQASVARTPAWEWGAPSFQRRAAALTTGLEKSLRKEHPSLPPHTRIYLKLVPQGLGAGEKWFEPVVQTWYADTTITVERLSHYRLRSPGVAGGQDLFFGWVGLTSLGEIQSGPEDVTEAIRLNPYWPEDHKSLALAMGQAGDWRGAAVEIEKLSRAFPEDPQYPTNMAYCLGRGGDAVAAARWQRRADSLLAATGGVGAR